MVEIVVGMTDEAEDVSLDTLTVPVLTVVGIVFEITEEAEVTGNITVEVVTRPEVTVVGL